MLLNQRKQTVRLLVVMGLLLYGELVSAGGTQGLAPGDGRDLIIENCTACHSTMIILQNRMTRDRWDETITWMQKEQGLWILQKEVRKKILDYLAKAQGPEDQTAPRERTGKMYRFDYPPNSL